MMVTQRWRDAVHTQPVANVLYAALDFEITVKVIVPQEHRPVDPKKVSHIYVIYEYYLTLW